MAKKVKPAPTGIWKQVGRVQRIGMSEGLRGRGSTWLAVGIGAWGLQRLRTMTDKEDEILLREPIGPGQTITITNQTTTRAEDEKAREQAQAEAQRQQKQDKRQQKHDQKAQKQVQKARKALPRAERRRLDAAEARREESARRRRRRRRDR